MPMRGSGQTVRIGKWEIRLKPRSGRPTKIVWDAKKKNPSSAEICTQLGSMSEMPEKSKSHYYTNATKKNLSYNIPSRRDTRLITSGTNIWSDEIKMELFGHTHERNFWRWVNKANDDLHRCHCEMQRWIFEVLGRHRQLDQNWWQDECCMLSNNLAFISPDAVHGMYSDVSRLILIQNTKPLRPVTDCSRIMWSFWLWNGQCQSSDINITDPLWGDVRCAVHTSGPKNWQELEAFCQQ